MADTLVSAIVQTFREKASQPERLLTRLVGAANDAAVRLQILVNDDSGEKEAEWRRHLRAEAGDVYLRSPNIHEVRAYNLLARRANGSLLVFLQGDECMPPSPTRWLSDAAHLFFRLPNLAVLGGHAGFDDAELLKGFGPYPRRQPIPFFVRGPPGTLDDASPPIAFAHVAGVNIGPYFVRREAFWQVGGFTKEFGGAGEPGGHFDVELCMRLWLQTRPRIWTAGLYYGGVGNGVGGHKTRIGMQAKLRKRNQRAATEHLRAVWSAHNATIGERITSANGQLLAAPPTVARELQMQRREGQRTCGGK